MPGLPFRNRSGHSLAAVFSWFLVLACSSLSMWKAERGFLRVAQACLSGCLLGSALNFPIFTEHTLPILLSLVNSASGPCFEGHFPYTAHPSSPIGHWNTLVVACSLLALGP